MIINNELCTQKYTMVACEEESEQKYNAPHHFEVANKETLEVVGRVDFQEGPIKECGVNGIGDEDAILMVLTRLEHFQKSEYVCRENEMAIMKLEETLMWLRKRTLGRANRGVEGTSQV